MIESQLDKQQKKTFLFTFLSFSIIFLLLGLIVFQLAKSSLYESTDNDLTRLSENSEFLNEQISHLQMATDKKQPIPRELGGPKPNNFQQQIIIWDKSGKIMNEGQLGSRVNDFTNLKAETTNFNKIASLQLSDQNNRLLQFRSLTIKSPNYETDGYTIQLLVNTDPIVSTMAQFKNILIICMVVFFALSVLLSYFLSKKFTEPIIASWKKQQQFVENASHELRTPLTIIQAKLENLFTKPERTILDESESIALSLTEVQRLSQLTTDLLLLARSDSNELVLKKEAVYFDELVTQTVTPYKELAEAEGKSFTINVSGHKRVLVDPEKIRQLLIILLDNALKYTEVGEQIDVSAKLLTKEWQLIVADTGKGIPDSEKKRVFERFYREDESRNRQTGGYGIGLSIAQWIVRAHKGKITVKDYEPKGVCFEIQLPEK
ncbi:two-component sensor histidine kinase [Enterococcus sp. JM4C]|uniref:sensor histidine kinase n=1 Tax=Candidatus Enterococcus huntleyi TaxID=1857217 RepID=UPI00192A2480|nr:HAMP domain-containing sensor histidine kinase [Enterococcus sp. JM4C]KAF1296951.1 two-component sensor histidine kinase [Enterococcus sp. JM4C]